jgi:signal transduction histidine kinase
VAGVGGTAAHHARAGDRRAGLELPLTSIKGFASTLLAEDVTWDPETQRDFLLTIDHEADKLTDMIGQLLDLARIEAGTLRIDPKPVAPGDILGQVLPQLQALTQDHTLETHLAGDLPPVRADTERVGQVLINLVGNAAKYAPRRTRIAVTATHEGDLVRVSVSDEGPGIPPQDRAHIFEAFRRGSSEYSIKTKGSGLGLAVCKGLIRAHGGKIWIEDSDQPGTTISFTLPAVSAPAASAPAASVPVGSAPVE